MKTIKVKIEDKYTDGRKNDYFFSEGPLKDGTNSLSTEEMTSYLRYKYIDFKKGEIVLVDGQVLNMGVPFIKETSYLRTSVTFYMEDDGVKCSKETLQIKLYCRNSSNNQKETIYLPYEVGAQIKTGPYPYIITVLETDEETVKLKVEADSKSSEHIVQLYLYAERNDEHYYATGNPNDPVDTIGPLLSMELVRK